jgi:hypothetical protein
VRYRFEDGHLVVLYILGVSVRVWIKVEFTLARDESMCPVNGLYFPQTQLS